MTVAAHLGSFRAWTRAQALPYSIFAAKAELDALIPTLQELLAIESHQANLPKTGKLSDLRGVPVVKFKDSPWSVVYWSIGRAPLLEWIVQLLSNKLQTSVFLLIERDTSGWPEWHFYKQNESLESAERMRHDDSVYFKSSLRSQPHLKKQKATELLTALDISVESLLIDQVVLLPGLDLNLADPAIERVDLLNLPALPLGMRDFKAWMDQGHPEYAIFAVKAPIAAVGSLLLEKGYVKEWKQQIQGDATLWNALPKGDKSYWIPMLQPTENRWTVVYWSVGGYENLDAVCELCSETLQTQAISFSEEDTSSAFGYELYDQGKMIEDAGYCDVFMFNSQRREEPEFNDFEAAEWQVVLQFIQQTFIEEGVYMPSMEVNIADPYLARVDFLRRY